MNKKAIIIITVLIIVTFFGFWLYFNYPRFYCPEGSHGSYYQVSGWHCDKDSSPIMDI